MTNNFVCRICGCNEWEYTDAYYCYCLGCSVLFRNESKFNLPEIKFKKLSTNATGPKKKYENDVLFELFSSEDKIIPPQHTKVIKTDISFEVQPHLDYQVRILPKLGNIGIQLTNNDHPINNDREKGTRITIYNGFYDYFRVNIGDSIAQLFITAKLPFKLKEIK